MLAQLKAEKLSFGYSRRSRVINQLSFKVDASGVTGIFGANGSGKTTLLNLLAGWIPNRSLPLFWNETYLSRSLVRIGYVFQTPRFSVQVRWTPQQLIEAEVRQQVMSPEWKSLFMRLGLNMAREASLGELSRGQAQKLQWLRVWCWEPELILLDEPFSALDQEARVVCREMLEHWVHAGKMVLLACHDHESISLCSQSISLCSHRSHEPTAKAGGLGNESTS